MRPMRPSHLLPMLRTSLRSGRVLGSAIGLSLLLAACGDGHDNTAGQPPNPEVPTTPTEPVGVACAALSGMALGADKISLPSGGATVTSATLVAANVAGNLLGDYCRVRGTIAPVDSTAPVIQFALNLPQNWNQKLIRFGGGGFNGRLIDGTETVRFGPADKPAPLALGYATLGDDSGHQSSSITDGRFALNDESLANYGGQAMKKTHDVALALLQAHYVRQPKLSYFLGTSTGGRDELAYIQRWPTDYQGVIANEPALNYTGTRLSNVAVGRALYNNGGAGWINVSKTLLVQKTVLAACDKLDGAEDGIVSNVESCRQLNTTILNTLRCAGGADTGDSCLSDAQLNTVRTIESPLQFSSYSLANNVKTAGGYNLLEGALVAGPYTSRNLGTRRVPGNPATSTDANMYVTGDQWTKFFVVRNEAFDTLSFDPLNPGSHAARVTEVSRITDATNPDLSPFFKAGGRLIMLHGLADEVISPNSTIDYYQQLITTVGEAEVAKSVRFYTVPGMGHGTGVFIPNWDSLAALEGWVEGGLAPSTAVAVDAVQGTYGRTRPLCQYPAWPKYRGSGSMDAAVNYSCVAEVGDPLACPNLPASATVYKGGNTLGEELNVNIDPATLKYTVTIDASNQRAVGTLLEGTLLPQARCTYASAENAAQFTLAPGGVLLGGVKAPTGNSAVSFLAFKDTFDNSSNAAVFNPVAAISNVMGVERSSTGMAVHSSSVRLRNAGTFQYCRSTPTGGFTVYDAACVNTDKGYISYNASHGAFDVYTTPANGGAVTTGGTLSGSMVIGLVQGTPVHLHLLRTAASSGMRMFAPQQSFSSGAADGSYTLLSLAAASQQAMLVGSSLQKGGGTANLAYDKPVLGLMEADGGSAGTLMFNGGVLGWVSAAGGNTSFEWGVRP